MRLEVGRSHHRMARNLRDLGLDGASPLFVQQAVSFRPRLNRGVELA